MVLKGVISVAAMFLFSNPVLGAQCDLEQKVDQLMSSYTGDKPGASVLVVEGGQVLLQKSYGKANREDNINSDIVTNYRLASVSKQFTAFAIVMLIDQGKLRLDDKLTDIFDDFPSYGKKVKVRHLLSHTSGLRKYERNVPAGHTGQLSDQNVLDILRSKRSTLFTPGSQYQYSNSGYAMMANIVAKISGLTFSEFVKENIFKPLNMDNSVVFKDGENSVENRAYGYVGLNRNDQNKYSQVLGDGGVYSSSEDYLKWENMLFHDVVARRQLIGNDQLFRQIFRKARKSNGGRVNYGFGWRISTYKGNTSYSHGGSTVGFKNYSIHLPSKELTVLILTNRRSGNPKRVAEQVIDCHL